MTVGRRRWFDGGSNGRMDRVSWFSAPGYWLSRLLFERALAAIYLIAFIVVLNQFRPLLGERGLTPVPRFAAVARGRRVPSLFVLRYSDALLLAVAWAGIALAAATLLGLPERGPVWVPMVVWLALWALYLSVLLLLRWLLFRLEFGAGMIKLRGDPCWRDLTCLYYHHETQPMPNALSS